MYKKRYLSAKKTGFIAACLTLFISLCSVASEVETLKQLNELIKAKRYAEAYALSNKFAMEYAGEPKFDFLMGMAAIKTQAYEESVFAFERATTMKPKWEQARFQLARAYYYVNNLAASKNELIKLKKDSTDPKFIAVISRFIKQVDTAIIKSKRQFNQVVSISSGYDSNINSGTDLSDVYLPQLGTEIPLSDDSKETKDTPLNISYQAQYLEHLSQNSLIIAQLGLFRTDYANTPAFERTLADLSLKYQDVLGDFTYQVSAFYRPMILNKAHYRDQFGYSANWILPINANLNTGWQVGYGKINNRQSSTLDLRDIYTTANVQYRIGRWNQTFMVNYTDVKSIDSTTQHRSHNFFKVDYKTSYIVSPQHQLLFDLQYQKFNYDVIDPAFLIIRDEDFIRTTLGWRYRQNDWMTWQTHYRYSIKSSNQNIPETTNDQAIFAYSRNEFSIGLTMQF